MKKRITLMMLLLLSVLICLPSVALATQENLSLSGKEIIEKLARLEEGQKGLNKRIDDLYLRLEQGQKALGERIEDQGKRIDDLRGLIYVVLAGIIALIGFVIWDRRTALSPVIRETKELEQRDDLTIRALKEYALKEPKLAEVLKGLGLL